MIKGATDLSEFALHSPVLKDNIIKTIGACFLSNLVANNVLAIRD